MCRDSRPGCRAVFLQVLIGFVSGGRLHGFFFFVLVRFGFPSESFPTAGFETFALFPFLVCVEDFFVVDEVLGGLDVVESGFSEELVAFLIVPSESSFGQHFLLVVSWPFSFLGMSFELVDTTNDGEHGQPVPTGVEFEENLVVFDERYLSVVLDFTSQVYGCFESCIYHRSFDFFCEGRIGG